VTRIVFVGPGGSGKTAAARILSDLTGMRHCSTSEYARDKLWNRHTFLAGEYANAEAFYADRVNRREWWARQIDMLNGSSRCDMYARMVEDGFQIIDGIRRLDELRACRECGIVDECVWVDRPGTSKDSSLDFGPVACSRIFPGDTFHCLKNYGDLDELRQRVADFCQPKLSVWGIPQVAQDTTAVVEQV